MSNIDKQALVIPQREKHDWSQAVMRDCDFCQQWALTVRHSDGGCICASCCDSEYTTALSSALVVAIERAQAAEKQSAVRLEALDNRIAELNTMRYRIKTLNGTVDIVDGQRDRWMERCKDAEAKLEAAEKRIAELEVRAFNPALLDVIAERQRQRSVEGWTSDHDDQYGESQLLWASSCYVLNTIQPFNRIPLDWPWAPEWWKPTNPRRDLVKAGALILAEIERIDRAAGKGE